MKNYGPMIAELNSILGQNTLYATLYPSGPWASVTSRVTIDNAAHEADALVDRLISFIDCMLEQIQREEPDLVTDSFTLTADGRRFQFDASELALDSDQPEWSEWEAIRERFLKGGQLEVGHQFIGEPADKAFIEWGLPKLLSDMLNGGRLAHCVTLTVIQDNGDYTDWHEFRQPYHQDTWKRRQKEEYNPFYGQRFWMNGNFNGEYVCGEVPFTRDEAAVMGISSWYQSELVNVEYDDHEGIFLTMAPNSAPEEIDKALDLAERFYHRLSCTVEVKPSNAEAVRFERLREPLSEDEAQHLRVQMARYFGGKAPNEAVDSILPEQQKSSAMSAQEAKPALTNDQEVHAFLECFSRMRGYFSDAEVEVLLGANVEIQDLYTRHAAEKYSDEEILLYRFGICVCLLLEEARHRKSATKFGAISPDADDVMGWPAYLYEKVKTMPESLKRLPEGARNGETDFVGMNDLSTEEAAALFNLYNDGAYIRIFDICLNNAEDIQMLENLLNELSALETELQRNHAKMLKDSGDADVKTSLFEASCYGWELRELWQRLLSEIDPRREHSDLHLPVLTNREFRTYIQKTGSCAVEADHILNDAVYFESMDMGTYARLRFRRECGTYSHEISVLD